MQIILALREIASTPFYLKDTEEKANAPREAIHAGGARLIVKAACLLRGFNLRD